MPARRRSAAVIVGLALIMVTASCSPRTAATVESTTAAPATAGGTLHILRQGPATVWDPQRLSVGADMAFAGRVLQRTLTAWAPATVAVIPLTNSRSMFVHGSRVVGYVDNQAFFGTVDLATVALR